MSGITARPSGDFPIGDILEVSFPLYTHYGLYVGEGMVIHNSKKRGKVVKESVAEFAV